jgi:hypothetical protein
MYEFCYQNKFYKLLTFSSLRYVVRMSAKFWYNSQLDCLKCVTIGLCGVSHECIHHESSAEFANRLGDDDFDKKLYSKKNDGIRWARESRFKVFNSK